MKLTVFKGDWLGRFVIFRVVSCVQVSKYRSFVPSKCLARCLGVWQTMGWCPADQVCICSCDCGLSPSCSSGRGSLHMLCTSLAWPDPIPHRGKGSGTWPQSNLSPRNIISHVNPAMTSHGQSKTCDFFAPAILIVLCSS